MISLRKIVRHHFCKAPSPRFDLQIDIIGDIVSQARADFEVDTRRIVTCMKTTTGVRAT